MFSKMAVSYRDLPLRLADFSPLHRNELTGTLRGLTRLRKFCQVSASTPPSSPLLSATFNRIFLLSLLSLLSHHRTMLISFVPLIRFSKSSVSALSSSKMSIPRLASPFCMNLVFICSSYRRVELSTRPEKFMGERELWDQAESILSESLQSHQITYEVSLSSPRSLSLISRSMKVTGRFTVPRLM